MTIDTLTENADLRAQVAAMRRGLTEIRDLANDAHGEESKPDGSRHAARVFEQIWSEADQALREAR